MSGRPSPFTAADIERRLLLWIALANLYLDTMDDAFVPEIIEAAHAGNFTRDEVETILKWEIRPALYFNYLNPAGAWVGWDADWLVKRISDTAHKKSDRLLLGNSRFLPDEWPDIQAAMAPS